MPAVYSTTRIVSCSRCGSAIDQLSRLSALLVASHSYLDIGGIELAYDGSDEPAGVLHETTLLSPRSRVSISSTSKSNTRSHIATTHQVLVRHGRRESERLML